VAAFAAIESFGTVLEHYFGATASLAWLGVLIMVIMVSLVILLGQFIRRLMMGDGGNEHYHEECADSEFVFTGLTSGLLVSMAIRQTITGTIPPIHGSPMNKTSAEVWSLFVFAWAAECFLFAIVVWRRSEESMEERGYGKFMRHLVRTVVRVTAMLAGWLFMYWGEWVFWSKASSSVAEEDIMVGKTALALTLSFVVFLSFFAITRIRYTYHVQATHAAGGLISSFALLLGLSWESVFCTSIESISFGFEDRPALQIAWEIGLTLFLCAIVIPAWVLYILPKVEEDNIDDCATPVHDKWHAAGAATMFVNRISQDERQIDAPPREPPTDPPLAGMKEAKAQEKGLRPKLERQASARGPPVDECNTA
jgi:hypothetical protein